MFSFYLVRETKFGVGKKHHDMIFLQGSRNRRAPTKIFYWDTYMAVNLTKRTKKVYYLHSQLHVIYQPHGLMYMRFAAFNWLSLIITEGQE